MTKHVVWLFAVVGCAHSARPPVAAIKAPALTGEMAKLSFYVGEWSCKGSEIGEGDKVTAEYPLGIKVSPLLDGSWLSIIVEKDGAPITAEFKGYNPTDKKFHHVWAVGGGEWGSLSSEGWKDGEMTFVDDRPGTTAERMVFHKDSDTHYTHRAEAQDSTGWHATFRKVCDKRA